MSLVPFPDSRSEAYRAALEDEEETGPKMSFLEHLDEFRKRLVNALVGILVGVLAGFFFVDKVFDFVFEPTRRALPPGVKLIYTQPGEAFSLYIQISLIVGTLVAAPWVMYQVWLFIAPGLFSKEKMVAIPFVVLTTLGLVLGAAFNHFIAFPLLMAFFASFNTPDLNFMPKVTDVFDLYAKMTIGMAIIFQMPTVVFFLAKMKLITARFLWSKVRYAILITFVVSGLVTPTGDPMNQAIFAAPMIVLYLVSIVIAWLVGLKRPKASKVDA